jgi:hypothetical protein
MKKQPKSPGIYFRADNDVLEALKLLTLKMRRTQSDTIRQVILEAAGRLTKPDPLGQALNEGDGVYRP